MLQSLFKTSKRSGKSSAPETHLAPQGLL